MNVVDYLISSTTINEADNQTSSLLPSALIEINLAFEMRTNLFELDLSIGINACTVLIHAGVLSDLSKPLCIYAHC